MKKFTLISLPLCAVTFALLLLALTPWPAHAQSTPPPCDPPFSDCLFVSFNGDGTTFVSIGEPDTGELLPLIGGNLLIGGGPVLLEILEPASEGGGISDLILFSHNPAACAVEFCFASNAEGSIDSLIAQIIAQFPPTGPPLTIVSIIETGEYQDVTDLLGLTSFRVLISSDVEPVPEPSTWLLFGSGLAGLAAWRRKQVG